MPFPVDECYIHETELKLGIVFPAEYRIQMIELNGGEALLAGDEWQLFPFFDKSDKNRLKRTCNDVIRETEEAKKWYGFPPDAIAIGANGSGDKLILLKDPKQPGLLKNEVFWWNHETAEVTQAAPNFKRK